MRIVVVGGAGEVGAELVINAPPGFATVAELPRLRYRHFPLDSYVGGSDVVI